MIRGGGIVKIEKVEGTGNPRFLSHIGKVVAGGMLREGTPLEDYREEYGIWVKREDKACLPPGPAFSKARGVYARILSREEEEIGVLDTYHSQAGHAVARACQVLGKKCLNFYPEFKHEPGPRAPQLAAESLGAELFPLKAGRSAILFHACRKECLRRGAYLMPNALKLTESVEETCKEVPDPPIGAGGPKKGWDLVILPVSSGTIAAGVIKGIALQKRWFTPSASQYPTRFLVHLGYSRSHEEVRSYIEAMSGVPKIGEELEIVDEKYSYKDTSRPLSSDLHGLSHEETGTPPWPCNLYYDLKAFRWWLEHRGDTEYKKCENVLFWNVG